MRKFIIRVVQKGRKHRHLLSIVALIGGAADIGLEFGALIGLLRNWLFPVNWENAIYWLIPVSGTAILAWLGKLLSRWLKKHRATS